MKISSELISLSFASLSSSSSSSSLSSVIQSSGGGRQHAISVVVVSALILFAQCFANGLTSDEQQWLNDAAVASAAVVTAASVAITDSMSAASNSPSSPQSSGEIAAAPISKATTTTTKTSAQITTAALFSARPSHEPMLYLASTYLTRNATLLSPSLSQSMPTSSSSSTTKSSPLTDALVLIQSTKHIKLKLVRDQFQQFIDMFGVKLQNITIDFDIIDGLSTLVKRLDTLNYSTVYYIFDGNNIKDFGNCDMSQQLSTTFRKNIIFWPCPQMKKSERNLPSFETISYAIKSVSQKFNWTEAIIFAGNEWGLPLAIAANLHLPYRIKIGFEDLGNLRLIDSNDKLLIITSPLNSPETLKLLTQLTVYNHTKILIIDIIGTIFNKQNDFYKTINRNKDKWLTSNLLVLTTLTAKLKRFLNATFTTEYNNIYGKSEVTGAGSDAGGWLSENDEVEETANSAENIEIKAIREKFIVELLTKRIESSEVNGSASTNSRRNRNILVNFNETELNAIVSVFRIFFTENCTKSVSNIGVNINTHTKNHNQDPHAKQTTNKQNTTCAMNINSLSKCETYLHETKAFVNISHPIDTVKVLCKQVQDRMRAMEAQEHDHSTMVLNGSSGSNITHKNESVESDIEANRTEFIHLIPNQNDTKFSEYFTFFDFIVTKLAQSHNLNVNYNNISGAGGGGNSVVSDTFDFCVLDFHLNRVSSGGSSGTNGVANRTITITTTFVWRPFLILRQSELHQNIFVTHPLMVGYHRWFFDNTSKFWSCGLLCWILAGIVLLLLISIFVASITFGLAIRNYLVKKRLSKGPNKIVLSAADFVFPIDARRVDEGIEAMLCCWLQQLQEFGGPEVEKPDLLKGSIGSLKNLGLNNATSAAAAATSTASTAAAVKTTASGSGSIVKHNNPYLDKRARYNGDLVQLKEVPTGTSNELKSKAMDHLVMAHGLRHENINPLIGWLADPIRTAMVFEYCSRGSLQDVLIMDDIKLDWSFRLSLLTDLVRGMRYLHSSPQRVHGSLTSRNCVVDARWVLKVTDYGLNQFYEAQGVPLPPKNAKQLLWTAPELLRNSKGQNKHGTQLGDVYSFGIIMQEVVVRGEPYCMLSLSADEIISKIKKPPPLIRPSVSKGAAPPEAINIMRQCWAEMPDMRPDFNSVYERFKVLNHGRKVNFVDTMFQMLEKYSNNLEELIRERTEQLDIERKKTEQLLNRMLPNSVAEKLKVGLCVEPEEFSDVTIYFSDIVGFTTIAAYCSPVQVVDLLNDLYTCFDATINAYSVYKVETIGDAYMVVSGLPVRIPDHAEQIATMALDLLHQSGRFKIKHLPEVPLQLRIGLHTGPCCAGVVGLTMPRYCLFGDTVNTASRMESTGSSWRIHLSEATRERLEKAGRYHLEPRGSVEIKGKGLMNTYWLLGKKGFDKVLPTPPPIGESHGLDETLIQHCIRSKTKSKTPCISTTHSSSQSSSLAGEQVDVKVEITPPRDLEMSQVPNSYSMDSSQPINLSINLSDFKTPSTSPQQRKLPELPNEGMLNATNFGRLTPSPSGGSSCKLYKKFEEFMDLSSPYNHYRCLSPSESNLTQCNEGKYVYGIAKLDNKPGSSRLLRRQFSLDKDDCQATSGSTSTGTIGATTIAQMKSSLDVPLMQELPMRSSPSPTNIKPGRLHKQTSASVAQDLEKIEEIPISPTTCLFNNHRNILSQIPGSAAGSPASKKHEEAAAMAMTTVTITDDAVQTSSLTTATALIAANNSNSSSNNNNNNGREISLNVQSLILR